LDQGRGRNVNTALKTRYDLMVTAGALRPDAAQLQALAHLESLRAYLQSAPRQPRGLLRGLFRPHPPVCPPGLYLWGGVGVGKSMLMDLFFRETRIALKRRVHFHAFMQEVHEAMLRAQQVGVADPLASVAAGLAAKARLLCFDEMQISDITDAMLVGRLFKILLNAGVVMVVTSNRAPDDLYKNGLNRQLFQPFIDLIKARLDVHHLRSDLDYRQDRLRDTETYFSPNDAVARERLDAIWQALTDGVTAPLVLDVKGHELRLPRAGNGVVRVGFDDLCAAPRGAADYLQLVTRIRVLMLEDIPVMSAARSDAAKRFVTLIDALYEAGTRLICSAEATPEALYPKGFGAFEYQRTASRLAEMQAADWGNS